MKQFIIHVAVLLSLASCSSKNDPQPDPQPEDIWVLTGYDSGNTPGAIPGYLERYAYYPDGAVKTITGDTLTASSPDPHFSNQQEFIYEGGKLAKVKEFNVYERTYHIAYELQYDAQNRVSAIDQYTSSITDGRKYLSTRRFQYNAAGRIEAIEEWDTEQDIRKQKVTFTWSGNDVTKQDAVIYSTAGAQPAWTKTFTYNDTADFVWKTIAKELLTGDTYYHHVPHEHQLRKVESVYSSDNMTVTDLYDYTHDERGLNTLKKQTTTFSRNGQELNRQVMYEKYYYQKKGS